MLFMEEIHVLSLTVGSTLNIENVPYYCDIRKILLFLYLIVVIYFKVNTKLC